MVIITVPSRPAGLSPGGGWFIRGERTSDLASENQSLTGREAASPAHHAIARALVASRRVQTGIGLFPGSLPTELDDAYDIQALAVAAWPDRIAGWKVGRINEPLANRLGANRFIGPVFARAINRVVEGLTPFPICTDGFGAFEAECVAILGKDIEPDRTDWTAAEARSVIQFLHIGVEVAGSPIASINALGPLASIAAFGNNAGLILGPAIDSWESLTSTGLRCTVHIDGMEAGKGSAADLPGGPFAALAFALNQAARLNLPLARGEFVLTGAITGVHPITIGQNCCADFGVLGRIDCVGVAAIGELW